MKALLHKYADKVSSQGLADKENLMFLALDDELYAIEGPEIERIKSSAIKQTMRNVFGLMNINALLFAFPAEPYGSIIKEIIRYENRPRTIVPEDCETRTFFHDIPVIDSIDAGVIAEALSHRKSAILDMKEFDTPAVVSYGSVSPEQAFISFSSTCFSTFVKYFYDLRMELEACRILKTSPDPERIMHFHRTGSVLKACYGAVHHKKSSFLKGPARSEETILSMIDEAGKRLVEEQLVDSFFGNISALYNDVIYISETASSLDELPGAVDAVPLDGSSSVGITSSSEYSAHRAVYENSTWKYILHGHPKFSVIMSMVCLKKCRLRGQCYRACKEERDLFGIPIIPGEIGTGPTGIVNTLPGALRSSDSAIVHGHGVFTAGALDFNEPFVKMREIEERSRGEYFARIYELGGFSWQR